MESELQQLAPGTPYPNPSSLHNSCPRLTQGVSHYIWWYIASCFRVNFKFSWSYRCMVIQTSHILGRGDNWSSYLASRMNSILQKLSYVYRNANQSSCCFGNLLLFIVRSTWNTQTHYVDKSRIFAYWSRRRVTYHAAYTDLNRAYIKYANTHAHT